MRYSGYDGGGPEGLPHSIIVTAEGTEGDAPCYRATSKTKSQRRKKIVPMSKNRQCRR